MLDIRLPDIDGFEVCRALRAAGCWSPILMLTARDAVDDRVRGLDIGADDYLTKPFEFPELFARVRALVRRGGTRRPARLAVGASSSTRPRTLRGTATPRSTSRQRSSRYWSTSCATQARRSRGAA